VGSKWSNGWVRIALLGPESPLINSRSVFLFFNEESGILASNLGALVSTHTHAHSCSIFSANGQSDNSLKGTVASTRREEVLGDCWLVCFLKLLSNSPFPGCPFFVPRSPFGLLGREKKSRQGAEGKLHALYTYLR
jgi:hypothetical protein